MAAHGRFTADEIIRDIAAEHTGKAKALRADATRDRAAADEKEALAGEHEAIAWDLAAVAKQAEAAISEAELKAGGRPT